MARIVFLIALVFASTCVAAAQGIDRDKLVAQLETERCVTLEERKLKFCKFDYQANGKNVEAIAIFPLAAGKYPGVLLLPGFQGTAKTLLGMGGFLAPQGFAILAVTPPGFGKSEGKSDFMGPASIDAFATGFRKFRRNPGVDSTKMGILGYSRGGMAASLLTIKLGNEVQAAVFGAGIYDFQRAYDDTKFDGIRANMKAETGMTEKAIKERSSILRMEKLRCPVLIIHGENDGNAPTNQAYFLRDRLTELKKDFEFKILPDHVHGQLKGDFLSPVLDFLSRKLKGVPASVEMSFAQKVREEVSRKDAKRCRVSLDFLCAFAGEISCVADVFVPSREDELRGVDDVARESGARHGSDARRRTWHRNRARCGGRFRLLHRTQHACATFGDGPSGNDRRDG